MRYICFVIIYSQILFMLVSLKQWKPIDCPLKIQSQSKNLMALKLEKSFVISPHIINHCRLLVQSSPAVTKLNQYHADSQTSRMFLHGPKDLSIKKSLWMDFVTPSVMFWFILDTQQIPGVTMILIQFQWMW